MIITHLVLLKLLDGASAQAGGSTPSTVASSDLGGDGLRDKFVPPGLAELYNLRGRTQ